MKENKKYTATDFAPYYSGAMPPHEMHALEKAALEDPFLADALEGYQYSKDTAKELDEIKMRLAKKRKRNNVFSLSSLSSAAWWKIAAMFVIIAGAGYFFLTINSQKEHSLAIKKNEIKKESTAIVPPANADSDSITEDNLAFEKTVTGKDIKNKNSLPTPKTKSIETSPLKKTMQEEIKNKKEKQLTKKYVTSEKENTMVMNNAKAVAPNITMKDSGEKSFFRSSDTTAMVAASPGIYDSNVSNAVAMNKPNPALKEVVVTGYGTKKKSHVTGELEGKVSGVAVNTSTPYLKEGKENFEQYIKDNALPVLDSSGKKLSANILLSFVLDKKSNPTHIKILRSDCKPCEAEAIRLLKDGPQWIGKKGAKGTVRIQF